MQKKGTNVNFEIKCSESNDKMHDSSFTLSFTKHKLTYQR